ncbi:MAG: apolipoprotein N-acyltransferase, partial [Bacteroidales bacterium]|nr:apolipoprotein N-acyltransferase [Bacteroidales bacterium]
MKKYHLLLLSALSGVLLCCGWPVNGFPILLFFAFIPLLFIEDHIYRNRINFSRFSVFFYTYPAFFIWNFLITWWIWNSTPVAILAWILNALFMAVVFNIYHITRRVIYRNNQGYFVLVFYWITFEFLHLDWDLSWIWLNLGNGFACYTKWIQWYEYTGVFGGTFWVLIVNIFIYKISVLLLDKNRSKNKIVVLSTSTLFLIIVPIIISYFIYYNYEEKEKPVNVVVIQPNLDPYNEQYSLPPLEVIDRNIELAIKEIDSSTKFIVSPESAIQEGIWEDQLNDSPSIKKLRAFNKKFSQLRIVIGASSYKRFNEEEPLTNTARKHKYNNFWYDAYNTAMLTDTSKYIQIHHKSKLTPGVEKMPSWKLLKPLEKYAIDLGGTLGSLGSDKEKKVFIIQEDSLIIAPVICYESVYGEYCAEFVKKGANLIFVITNDGWWGNTPGYKQHFSFSPMRAIETRRSIARSANTGISAFINQRGDVLQPTSYWEPAVIQQNINANSDLTFYVKYGNYIGRISMFVSA